VEDDCSVRAALRRLLRAAGYAPIEAYSGIQAMELAQRSRPHVILLDMKMKNFDGPAIAREIKTHPELGKIPIIALTASPELVRDCDSLFRVVLTKPCRSVELFRAIEDSSAPDRTCQ
jgi:CheY-like chemotaxis protein